MPRIPGVLLAGLLTLAAVFALGCQQEMLPVRVTATPDIPATVTALVQEELPTATPMPTPTLEPTPNIEATVEARLLATVAAMPTAALVPTPTPQPTDTPTPTPTPTPTATPTPSPTPTSTPTSVPTATPTPRPTYTPRPTLSPIPTWTPTPLPPLKFDRASLLFGPVSGSLAHEPKDGKLEGFQALNAKGDLLIETTFHNPYSDAEKSWEHGFLLKHGGGNKQYWVSIDSRGSWLQFHRLGEAKALDRRTEQSSEINILPGGKNLLQVLITGDTVWVYINGVFQGSFDMSVSTGGDGIRVFTDDEYEGNTRYEDFTVWKWSPAMLRHFTEADPNVTPTPGPTPNPKVPVFGPVSGSILHDSEDGYLAAFQGPEIQGDLMLEVIFEVPFAPNESHWNFGILFRGGPETYHRIEITSKFGGSYVHRRRAGPNAEVRGRIAEDLPGLNLQKGEQNHIRFIVIGKEGWFYVNDRRAAIIPFTLGNLPNPDEIRLVINDIDVYGYEYDRGGKTRFEDFTIWKWRPSLFKLPKED